MTRWRRRQEREPDAEPPLPLTPGPLSNGEFLPDDPSPHDRLLRRLALERSAMAADRVGMDRRRFLQTSAGVAATLAVYNLAACSSDGGGRAVRSTTSGGASPTTSTDPGGSYTVPAPEEVEACEEALGDRGEFIFDVHTHHVVPEGPWRENARRIATMIAGLALTAAAPRAVVRLSATPPFVATPSGRRLLRAAGCGAAQRNTPFHRNTLDLMRSAYQ